MDLVFRVGFAAYLPEIELPELFSFSEVEQWVERVEHEPLRIAIVERWRRLAVT